MAPTDTKVVFGSKTVNRVKRGRCRGKEPITKDDDTETEIVDVFGERGNTCKSFAGARSLGGTTGEGTGSARAAAGKRGAGAA